MALFDTNWHAIFSLSGPDRVRYLNAVVSNDIKSVGEAYGTRALLLNPQGHILAELEVYALAEKLLVRTHASVRERTFATLDKYIIMDDVTLTDETGKFGALALEGPKTAEAVRELTASDFTAMPSASSPGASSPSASSLDAAIRNPESGRSAIPCRLVCRSKTSAEFIVARNDLPALWKILQDTAKRFGGGPMGYTALSAQRLVQGVPWFGYDFGEKQIPHEAGLQNSHISYTKGCYTGQEIVERVRSRGQVNRQRIGLLFASGTQSVPPAGAPLTLDGAEAGYVTRAAKSFYPPAILAMGYARRESAGVGTVLDCSGGRASVVNLPITGQPHQPV